MVERVLVVGPRDTISMVDDLAPKGFEIVKALHNSPEMKAALPGTTYFVGFVQQYVTPQLFKEAPKLKLIQMLSAGYDRADLDATRQSPAEAQQRDPDGASRRAHLREQHHPPAQWLRQRPARGARRARALGGAGAARIARDHPCSSGAL